jgi:hypothetical protein
MVFEATAAAADRQTPGAWLLQALAASANGAAANGAVGYIGRYFLRTTIQQLSSEITV